MTQKRRLGRAFLIAATLAAGTVPASCEMTWHDSFVAATKDTFLVATSELLGSLLGGATQNLGDAMNTGT